MEPFQPCLDTSDLSELSHHHHMHLKPEAKISITVALPNVRLPGKTISNWEVMERLRQVAQPDEFQVIKVNKTTLEFIKFYAEIENRAKVRSIISKLDGKFVRLSGFPEPLKIKAAEAKPEFPTRHDWDRYFRDAKNMNEMKPGERPDTVHIQGLPSVWFAKHKGRHGDSSMPCEAVLKEVFGVFGEVRCVDIPMLDPYRNMMKASISGIRTFSHASDTSFDAFIQFKEYICFVKAMDSLRGMKLVRKENGKAFSSSIKVGLSAYAVTFDKTKHLSDLSIRRRAVEREKLIAKEREVEEKKRKEEEAVKRAIEAEERRKVEEKAQKGERRKEREEKRKQRILKKLKKKESEQMNIKIAIEERKLLMAQRKLESIRLLDELFERVKIERQKEVAKQKDHGNRFSKVKHKTVEKLKIKEDKEVRKKQKSIAREKQLRKKLVNKIKNAQEQQMVERREKLRQTIEGRSTVKVNPVGETVNIDRQDFMGYDYSMSYDPYQGYGYGGDWGPRGGFRGRFFPRRLFRGIRPYRSARGGFQGDWWPPHNSEWMPIEKKDKTGADDMEDVSSDPVSSDSSKYSKLNSSDEEKKKVNEKKEDWPAYDVNAANEVMPSSHPWSEYSDYYNPRYMRRASRRPSGNFRSWPSRGGYGVTPNPNVPMNSFYMQSINNQYYRYFNRLAKGERKSSRSKSNSSERVVCRKVLSRSRSRGKSSSRTRSSHTRSRSRSRSKSRSRPRSRNRSSSKSKRSNSRSRSKSKSSISDDSKSDSKSNKQKETKELSDEEKRKKVKRVKDEVCDAKHKETDDNDKAGSDFSLSLSGSDGWSKGSPERKAKPLGDPNWEPSERRFRRRSFRGYDRSFAHYNFEVRSHVTRPDRHRSRSKSRDHHSRRQRSRKRRGRDSDKRSGRSGSRSRESRHRRSRSGHSRSDESPKPRSEQNSKRDKEIQKPSTSKKKTSDLPPRSTAKHKKEKKSTKSSHKNASD